MANHVVVNLSPTPMDRLRNAVDWYRREVRRFEAVVASRPSNHGVRNEDRVRPYDDWASRRDFALQALGVAGRHVVDAALVVVPEDDDAAKGDRL